MQPETRPHLDPAIYLDLERRSEVRSEWLDGEVVAMTGGSREHNLIVGNLVGELRAQLKRRPCEVYPSDLRVRVPAGLYTYPDVVVACGEPRFEDEHRDTLLNPTLLVEVLSRSTEAYDRGEKFERYRTLDSLAEYLLVSQTRPHVEQFLRQPDGRWLLAEATGLEATIDLPSIGCRLALAEVYERVFAV